MEVSDTMEKAFQKFEPAPRRGEAPEVGCNFGPAILLSSRPGPQLNNLVCRDPFGAALDHTPRAPWQEIQTSAPTHSLCLLLIARRHPPPGLKTNISFRVAKAQAAGCTLSIDTSAGTFISDLPLFGVFVSCFRPYPQTWVLCWTL